MVAGASGGAGLLMMRVGSAVPAAETGGGAADGRSTAGGDEGVRAVFAGALPVVVVGAAVDVALVPAVNPRLSSAES